MARMAFLFGLAVLSITIGGCKDTRGSRRDSGITLMDSGPPPGDSGMPMTDSGPSIDAGPQDGDLRIAGGGTMGRLEIFHDGMWGTICDDGFGPPDATVACRQLGYTSGTVSGTAAGTGMIWMDTVECIGTETALASCPFDGWAANDCTHMEDVAVSCL